MGFFISVKLSLVERSIIQSFFHFRYFFFFYFFFFNFIPISGPTDIEDPPKEINDGDTNKKPLNGHSKTINGDKPKEKPKPPPKPKVLVTADGKIKPIPPARATKV